MNQLQHERRVNQGFKTRVLRTSLCDVKGPLIRISVFAVVEEVYI